MHSLVLPFQNDRPCPVEDCSQRFLTAKGVGKHLMLGHEDVRRWADDGLPCKDYRHEGMTIITDDQSAESYIRSDYTIQLPSEPEQPRLEER